MKTGKLRLAEPVVWAALLVCALGFAYQTWTRDPAAGAAVTGASVWVERPASFRWASYEAEDRTARIERRGSGDDAFYWGVAVRARPIYEQAPDDPLVFGPAADTTAFVVNDVGEELVEGLAAPRALRAFGVVDDARVRDYGLAEPAARLSVAFGDRVRKLEIGEPVFGSNDRYVRDPAAGRIYVLAGEAIEPLEEADMRLAERRLHAFAPAAVARVSVLAAGRERVMTRSGGARPGEATWTAPDAPDRPDRTFANFMDRLGRLAVLEYAPDTDVSVLEPVVRVDYFGPQGDRLGFLELFRRPGEAGAREHLLRTELTRVPVRTFDSLAEEVAADVAQLF